MVDRWTERRLLTIPPDLLPITPNGPVTISISPDALHAAAFAALRPHGPFVLVRDEPRGPRVQGVLSRPSWSADGARFACVLQGEDGRARAVIDEKPSPKFAQILSSIFFSPDGSSFSYTARERDRLFVLVDHSPVHEETYAPGADAMRRAPGPRWSTPAPRAPDAIRSASDEVLRRLNAGDPLESPAGEVRLEFDMRGNPLTLRVGPHAVELQRPFASALETVAWDAAGHWGAVLARERKGRVLVLDGAERGGGEPVLFAVPGGGALVYNERRPTGLFVVVGARAVGPFQWLGEIECSPDALQVAFSALDGRDVRRALVPLASS
jgi:hypothetical protein